MEKQYAAAKRASERDDAATRAYYTYIQQADSQRSKITQAESEIGAKGLTTSRRGEQILDQARKNQEEQNRLDDYKFADEQVNEFVNRMRKRGSGQSYEDYERYSSMSDDDARMAARRQMAEEQAARENPSMRDQAAAKLDEIKSLLQSNFDSLKTYAHVT